MQAGCIPHRPGETQRLQAGRTVAAWMKLEGTEVGGTPPGVWQEGWMKGSLELENGSGLAVCVHAGGERGRCREQTWAWSRPGRRRAEDERLLQAHGHFDFIQFKIQARGKRWALALVYIKEVLSTDFSYLYFTLMPRLKKNLRMLMSAEKEMSSVLLHLTDADKR